MRDPNRLPAIMTDNGINGRAVILHRRALKRLRQHMETIYITPDEDAALMDVDILLGRLEKDYLDGYRDPHWIRLYGDYCEDRKLVD